MSGFFHPHHSHWRHHRHWRRMGLGRLLIGLFIAPMIFKRAMCGHGEWHGGGYGGGYGGGGYGGGYGRGCHGHGEWRGPRESYGPREWRGPRGGHGGPHGPDYV